MKSVIIGTAGHIDHGKTALVRALTGIDADRLEEEKRRGITIDIGFAHLDLTSPGGELLRLGFVDVPGHERFVRNMLAGVGGIDMVLLVIGADEGIKPQTREHFDICRMLNVRRGITVLTKADLVDAETLEVVKLEIEEFVRGSFLDTAQSPIVAVSSKTGAGLERLRTELARAALEVPGKDTSKPFRLPIDRVFSIKGFGTVVTGTLVGGSVGKDEEVELMPDRRNLRVRGVQVHDESVERAMAGQRTAINIAGAEVEELARGKTLVTPKLFRPTSRVNARLTLLKSERPLRDHARVHFHCNTAETVAEMALIRDYAFEPERPKKEIAPGESCWVQLRFAEPQFLLPGDRFILRQFSPVVTIGGGVTIEVHPDRSTRYYGGYGDYLERLAAASSADALAMRVMAAHDEGLTMEQATALTGLGVKQIEALLPSIPQIRRIGDTFIDARQVASDGIGGLLVTALNAFHDENPLAPGMNKQQLRGSVDHVHDDVFAEVIAQLLREKRVEFIGDVVRVAGRGVVMKDEEAEAKQKIEAAFASAGLKVPALKDVLAGIKVDRVRAQKIVTLLLRDKVLIKLSDDLVFHASALEGLRKLIATEKAKAPKIDVARFKDLTGVSRKYAIPLLEYLDREKVTRRVGDERVIL